MSTLQKDIDRAIQFHTSGNLKKAESCYKSILKQHADNFDALHMYGVLMYQQNKFSEAIQTLNKAFQQNNSAEVLTNLGTALKAKGDLNKARDAFIHAIKLKPNLTLAHYNLGNTFRELEDYDSAINAYKHAIKLNPNYFDAIHNIAIVYKLSGMYEEALQAGQLAVSISPNNAETQFHLAGVLMQLGEQESAIQAYKKTLECDPNNMTARHLLSALTGQTTEKPPNEYITDLFDDFASTFDDKLVNELKYQTPQEIYNLIISVTKKCDTFSILDLGCGTGLCGKLLIKHASFLAGVDLSRKMVSKAKERGIYHELKADDIQTYLDNSINHFDIIVSADVFVYVGDLEQTFKRCKKRLKKKGIFAFSIEIYPESGYKLLETGRYAHSEEYIRKLASDTGLSELDFKSVVLREQHGKPVHGAIFILENPDDI